MTVQDLENIKDKIETAKETRDKAKGAKDRIELQLKNDFEITDIHTADEKAEEMKSSIEQNEKKRDKFTEQLQDLADWESV